MKRNVFIPALEEQQRIELETLRNTDELSFHGLLDIPTLIEPTSLRFNQVLAKARQELNELKQFTGSVDAIIAHWDFPTSVLVPILCREYDIPAPSLESVLKCEHKYWSRLEQQKVIPEMVPAFCSVDPFADNPLEQVTLDYPFWLKPVKAFSSQLGFKIENEEQFHAAIEETRDKIRHFGEPFNEALEHADLPPEIHHADGNTCIAEQIISGTQGAPEGTMYRGEFNVHGVFDQPKDEGEEMWGRLEYPSSMPERIQRQMIDASRRFLEHIGYDNGCFNAEFMWDEEQDQLWLVEFNTRISQSHSEMFIMVDGMSNHEVAIDIALGQRPSMANRQGPYAVAAKCLIPHERKDGIVRRVPSLKELDALRDRFPGTKVRLSVESGMRLSELPNQDSYSYHIGTIYLGADTHEQIKEHYHACLEALHFEFDPVADERPPMDGDNSPSVNLSA
ncbi:ATP-grasp domain-containing protein [Halomonas sp. HP20-15]|uniref:ATP-grasp domain-containing protein n=1 Tax=Halomonas sp. HP20-15 TaxID=3085901 RepID=UPI0029815E6D|nr:ATP-grasp domain-containing protein [Halomonas sp. HP20-15]MDW5375816.1 ATP-grasp domain-containing protein [Halomonas sp. HP20-15]